MVSIGRIANSTSRLLFDPVFTEKATEAIKLSRKTHGWKNFHKQVYDGFSIAEKESLRQNPNLWKGMKKSLTTFPGAIKGAWNNAQGFGKFKAIGKEFWKRMPLIGGIVMVGFELPNILSAFQDKGLVGGITEVAKSGSRLIGSMAGFAIGQALIPIPVVGGLIGGVVGEWLIGKIVGKSHTEKKQEMQEALAQSNNAEQQALALQQMLAQQNNPYAQFAQNPYGNYNIPQATMTPQQIMQLQQMLYSGGGLNSPMEQDFMAMTSGINRLNYMV